jgi:sugar lactone lactonase YvrE
MLVNLLLLLLFHSQNIGAILDDYGHEDIVYKGLAYPYGIQMDKAKDHMYVVEIGTKKLRKIDFPAAATISTVTRFTNRPHDIVMASNSIDLYVSQFDVGNIVRVHNFSGTPTKTILTFPPLVMDVNGTVLNPQDEPFATPQGLALSPDTNTLYVADRGTAEIWAVHLDTDTSTTGGFLTKSLVAQGVDSADGISLKEDGSAMYVGEAEKLGNVWRIETIPPYLKTIVADNLDMPRIVQLSADESRLFIVESGAGHVHRLDLATKEMVAIKERMAEPYGLSLTAGGKLVVSERGTGNVVLLVDAPLPAHDDPAEGI